MASTNKTTNYNLSQFIGSDKPAWLSDYNQDMTKIDTAIKNASDTATSASGDIEAALTSIGDLTNLETTTKTNLVAAVNEVNGTAITAQGTANSASNAANTANTNIANLATYLDISTINTYTKNSFTPVSGTLNTTSLTVARNSAGTLGKIYGVIRHKPISTGIQTINLNIDTGLRPESDMQISPVGTMFAVGGSGGVGIPEELTITVKTNGYLTISYTAEFLPTSFYAGYPYPSLYFFKNWGDIPTPE